jgi:predicted phosphodiesterase
MTLRLGVLSDLHGSSDPAERGSWHNAYDFAGMPERVDDALAWLTANDADLVVLAGDLTHHADPAALEAVLRRCASATPRPLIVVSGNHDVAGEQAPLADAIERIAHARLTLARPEGERHGAVRIAGVNVASAAGWFHAGLERPPAVDAWGEDPVVLVSHFPLLSHAVALADRGLAYPGDVLDRAAIEQRLGERAAPTVILSGHVHARVVDTRGSLLQLTQAALIEPPFDAALVELATADDGILQVTRRTRRTGVARAPYEPALVEGDGAWRFDGASWVTLPLPTATTAR